MTAKHPRRNGNKSIEQERVDSLASLNAERGAIQRDIHHLTNEGAAPSTVELERQIESAANTVRAAIKDVQAAFAKLGLRRQAKGTHFRFQAWLNGITRNVTTPEWSDTLSILMVFWLFEGGLTGTMMIAEGRMDVRTGFSYGGVFALVNIITALITGYYPLRYLTYRLNSPEPEPHDHIIRKVALGGFVFSIFTLLVLIFSAARVRALGTHDGIFDFTAVGFFETFNDGIAIIIIVIGLASSFIAIVKGYSGFSDPVPGLSQARRDAEDGINEQALDIIDDYAELADKAADGAIERVETSLDDIEDITADKRQRFSQASAAIDAHNNHIHEVKGRLSAKHRGRIHIKEALSGKRCACLPLDLKAFDALLLEPLDLGLLDKCSDMSADIERIRSRLSDLESLHANAIAELNAAHTDFLASAPDLDIFPDLGGYDDDQTTQTRTIALIPAR